MTGREIQEIAFADFDLWVSIQDEETQALGSDEQATLYAVDEAWHNAVRDCVEVQ